MLSYKLRSLVAYHCEIGCKLMYNLMIFLYIALFRNYFENLLYRRFIKIVSRLIISKLILMPLLLYLPLQENLATVFISNCFQYF